MFYSPLIVVLLFGVSSINAQMVCDATIFKQCQDDFTTFLGIDNSLDWQQPDALLIAIQNIYISGGAAGQNGLVQVCNGYNKLVKCLNQNGLVPSDCINGLWLLAHDTNPLNAYGYAMIMSQIEWQCGAGFYPAIDNWDCIQRVYLHYNTTLADCIRNFRLNAQENKVDECRYAGIGMTCYRKPFRDTCLDPAVEYYGCESFREYINIEYSQCAEVCTVRTS